MACNLAIDLPASPPSSASPGNGNDLGEGRPRRIISLASFRPAPRRKLSGIYDHPHILVRLNGLLAGTGMPFVKRRRQTGRIQCAMANKVLPREPGNRPTSHHDSLRT